MSAKDVQVLALQYISSLAGGSWRNIAGSGVSGIVWGKHAGVRT